MPYYGNFVHKVRIILLQIVISFEGDFWS